MIWETSQQFSDKYEEIKRSVIDFTDALKTVTAEVTNNKYEHNLEQLKNIYGKDIRSVRQLDAARDVQALIYLLEKRLLLGWFDVDRLPPIMNQFEMEGSSTYNDLMNYRHDLAHFKVKHQEAFSSPPYDPDIFCEVSANKEVIPPQISERICRKIAPDYIKFGRELIHAELAVEGQLDELKRDKTLTDEEKMRRLLDIFVKGDKRTKRSQLCKILRSILRNDVEEEVDKLFMESSAYDRE